MFLWDQAGWITALHQRSCGSCPLPGHCTAGEAGQRCRGERAAVAVPLLPQPGRAGPGRARTGRAGERCRSRAPPPAHHPLTRHWQIPAPFTEEGNRARRAPPSPGKAALCWHRAPGTGQRGEAKGCRMQREQPQPAGPCRPLGAPHPGGAAPLPPSLRSHRRGGPALLRGAGGGTSPAPPPVPAPERVAGPVGASCGRYHRSRGAPGERLPRSRCPCLRRARRGGTERSRSALGCPARPRRPPDVPPGAA